MTCFVNFSVFRCLLLFVPFIFLTWANFFVKMYLFLATLGLHCYSVVAASGACSLVAGCGLPGVMASLVGERGLLGTRVQ